MSARRSGIAAGRNQRSMRFAIAGCGLIGQKRLDSLLGKHSLVIAADVMADRAERVASRAPAACAIADWGRAVEHRDVDAVIVATSNDALAPVTIAALEAGKHVMVEKPGGRSVAEVCAVMEAERRSGRRVHVGFNHRYHPAF